MSRIWRMGMSTGYLSVKASLNLWDSLVRSVLDFGSEVWGDEAWKEAEQQQVEMGRRILRCPANTTTVAIRGELGLQTMRSRRDLKKLMYWIHLLTFPDSRLVKHVYLFGKYCNLKSSWCGSIKQILSKYGLSRFWNNNKLLWNLDGNN